MERLERTNVCRGKQHRRQRRQRPSGRNGGENSNIHNGFGGGQSPAEKRSRAIKGAMQRGGCVVERRDEIVGRREERIQIGQRSFGRWRPVPCV